MGNGGAPDLENELEGGLAIVLSVLALALHNVVIGLIGLEGSLLGRVPVLSLLAPANAVLILWLRTLAIVPLMGLLAQWLYPPVWNDIRILLTQPDRRSLLHTLGGGFFLFLSQVLLYLAIGRIGPGFATALFFLYPLMTALLTQFLGDDRVKHRIGLGCLAVGGILTVYPSLIQVPFSFASDGAVRGISLALVAGVAFSFYQLSGRKLPPVPVTLIQFATLFGLSSLSLIAFPVNPAPPVNLLGLLLSGLGLGLLAVVSYGLNHVGMQALGPRRLAVAIAAVPLLTCLLSVWLLPNQTQFTVVQWLGVLAIAGGTAILRLPPKRYRRKAV